MEYLRRFQRRLAVLRRVLMLCALSLVSCKNADEPANDRDAGTPSAETPPANEAKAAPESPSAATPAAAPSPDAVAPTSGADPSSATAPDPAEDDEDDEDIVEGVALYKGVALPDESSHADIERLWPGTKARHEEDMPHITIVEDTKGTMLLYMVEEEGGVCLSGPGMASTDGFKIGAALHEVPDSARMTCQITVDDELLHLGDPCPGYYKGVKLVCEATDGDTFTHRLFFDLASDLAERSGELVQNKSVVDEFREAPLAAVLEGYGGGGEDGIFQPNEPPDRAPAAPAGPPTGPRKVLARTKAGDVEVHTHILSTKESIEAELPGFKARKLAYGGFNVHKGKIRVFELHPRTEGDPITSIDLVGRGLVDPKGIEVGMKWSDIKGLGSIECEGEAGEGYEIVGCQLEDGPYYQFDIPDLKDQDWGKLSAARTSKLLRGLPITLISVK